MDIEQPDSLRLEFGNSVSRSIQGSGGGGGGVRAGVGEEADDLQLFRNASVVAAADTSPAAGSGGGGRGVLGDVGVAAGIGEERWRRRGTQGWPDVAMDRD